MSKLKLALAQFGNSYGGQQALPLSVGCLWSYAKKEGLSTEYENPVFLYKKEAVSKVVARIPEDVDIVAFSAYIWNWRFSRAVAEAILEKSPKAAIVYGGVHVPDSPTEEWWQQHIECDYVLRGEGELSFASFLQQFAAKDSQRDWSKVPGLSIRGLNTERKQPPVNDLTSPYLDGTFDSLLPLEEKWTGLQESDRGCPYFCSFCMWGDSALNKIRQFPMNRVTEEITWFGKNRVEFVEGANANFGILPRDVQIAEHLAKTKEKYGFPQKYRAAFAKYSNKRIMDQVFSVASILNKSGQLKAVTLALQSTDDGVLESIDRKNISMSGFQELQERYKKDGIPTYIELIMGLPGETYSSFKAGIDKILNAGGHEGLSIYQCVILPNSEMDNPEYIKKHGLQSVPMRAMLLHGTPNKECPDEVQETVIATNSMPHEDWKKTWFLSWALQTFHSTHLTQWWAKEQSALGTPYSCFYERLIRTAEQWPESVLGRVYAHTSALLEAAIQGGSWDNVLPGFGDISWPPDEGAFLMIAKELHLFYSQMKLLKDMPVQQWEYGPPEIPQGKEEAYGKVFWYSRKGDLIGSLRKFIEECKEESKRRLCDD